MTLEIYAHTLPSMQRDAPAATRFFSRTVSYLEGCREEWCLLSATVR